ncbi:MAG: hypothetical protein QM713_04965 [Arachnia sp.]
MWIAIVVVGLVVLGFAAYAGTGRLGEMAPRGVIDRPRGLVPDGPVTDEFLAAARLPRASTGYAVQEVDDYLRRLADGTAPPAAQTLFTVTRQGYDMQVIDALLDRPLAPRQEDEWSPAPPELAP